MAVLGASRAFKDWQKDNGIDDEVAGGDAPAIPPPISEGGEEVKDFSDRELQLLEDEDPLSLIDSLSSRVGSPAPTGTAARTSCPLSFRPLADIRSNQCSRSTSTSLKPGSRHSNRTSSSSSRSSREQASSTSPHLAAKSTDRVRRPSSFSSTTPADFSRRTRASEDGAWEPRAGDQGRAEEARDDEGGAREGLGEGVGVEEVGWDVRGERSWRVSCLLLLSALKIG